MNLTGSNLMSISQFNHYPTRLWFDLKRAADDYGPLNGGELSD